VSGKHATIVEPQWSKRDDHTWLTYREFAQFGFLHGIVVFKGLPLDVPHSAWLEIVNETVRKGLVPRPKRLMIPDQIHSGVVRYVRHVAGGKDLVCDGLVVDEPEVMIGISVSDCLPLFAVNGMGGVAGLAHCGWRGVAAGIVEEFTRVVRGTSRQPGETAYLIGASIGDCCYEVRDDLLQRFDPAEVNEHAARRDGRVYFDLKGLVASRLCREGVRPGKISIDKTCTSCKKYLLSSYRAGGRDCGRMLAFIMLTG
jgi:YfiH family protein